MNRLAGEPSAYLRQHAHNPVHWQPFDPAAFAEAVARDVPIFLSVGYAACHWCHVMAGESFADAATGDYLNQHFVSIKVDREERPDVDDAYMAATQALSGQGGWPMSVFLTPDGRAFYAGTYFPPQPGPGRPSFSQVLTAVHEAWNERRPEVERTANELAEALSEPIWQVRAGAAGAAGGPGGPTAGGPAGVELSTAPTAPWAAATQAAVTALARAEDPEHGGLGSSPKFPPTPALEFLMRHAAGDSGASSRMAAGLAGRTLGAMVNSALFDQLAGGFARYSVSADWSEPHYEKMLYDNAGLLQNLVHWIGLAQARPLARPSAQQPPEAEQPESLLQPLSVADARRAAEATISWLADELRLPGGAFASSLDADTVIAGVHYEGASYQWSVADLNAAAAESVGPDGGPEAAGNLARDVAACMNIPAAGTAPFHPGRGLKAHERASWERIRPALLRQRAQRTMPARDDKVVAAWNGQLLAALAEAAMVLDRPDCLVAAVELGGYLQSVHWDGQLFRVSHNGRARGIKGLLDDHAACANGFLALYAATGEPRWFEFAGTLIAVLDTEFLVDGVVLNNAADNALPGSKFADPFDNATASGVAQLVQAFTSWAAYTGSGHHRGVAEALLSSLPDLARRAPRAAGGLLAAAQALTAGPLEVAIVGPAGPDRDALLRQVWLANSPGIALAVWDGIGPAPVPLFEGRGLPAGSEPGRQPLAYVCRNMVCARPVATPQELAGLL